MSDPRRRLIWILQQPTPYNDFLFRSVHASGAFDLDVHFMFPIVSSHPWRSKMAQGFNSSVYRKTLGIDWRLVREAWSGEGSFFVIAGWQEPTVQLCILARTIRRKPFALLTDTPKSGWEYGRGRIKSFLRRQFVKIVFKGAHRVMGTGTMALDRLAELGCPREKLVSFPYFIDLDAYVPGPRQSKPIDGEVVFASCGRLVNNIKAHDLAIRALAAVRARHPELRLKYRIAGVGPDENALRQLAADLGVTLELVSWLEPDELPGFYQDADVLLHPSHHDAYASAVLEAMGCGLAIVGSDETAAIVDRITDGSTGLIHKRGDLDGLEACIERLCSSAGEIRRLGQAGRAIALSWPGERAVEILNSVLQGS